MTRHRDRERERESETLAELGAVGDRERVAFKCGGGGGGGDRFIKRRPDGERKWEGEESER